MQTSAALQKKEQNKSTEVASSHQNNTPVDLKEESGTEAGMPLFLQRFAASSFTSPPTIQRQTINTKLQRQPAGKIELGKSPEPSAITVEKAGSKVAKVRLRGVVIATVRYYGPTEERLNIHLSKVLDASGKPRLRIVLDCHPHVRIKLHRSAIKSLRKSGLNLEVGVRPVGIEVKGDVESGLPLLPPREIEIEAPEEEEAPFSPDEPEVSEISEPEEEEAQAPPSETKEPEASGPEESATSIISPLIEKIRTELERVYIRILLNEAARRMEEGKECQSLLDKAAETAIGVLERKTSAFDPRSAKKEITQELLKATEHVMLLGGGEEAAESAMSKAAAWAQVQLDRAVEKLRVAPTEAAGREVAEKARTVMLLDGEATEALDLLETLFPLQTGKEKEELTQPQNLSLQTPPLIQKQEVDEEEELLQTKPTNAVLQRQPIEEEEEEEEPIQTKLTIGAPDDEYERQADQVADKVMRMPDSDTSQILEDEEEQPEHNGIIRAKSVTPLYIQRSCTECEEESQQKNNIGQPVQAKSEGSYSPTNKVAKSIQSPSNGSPLTDHVRSKIEPVLGSALRNVQVHSDSQANQSAKSINAKAFTHGNHIYLGQGESGNDLRLMAHETTHVIQQKGFNQDKFVQRVPLDDVTQMSITPEYAATLNDEQLITDIKKINKQLRTLSPRVPEYEAARLNLKVLDTEASKRNIQLESVLDGEAVKREASALKLEKAPKALSGIQLYIMMNLSQFPRGRVRTADVFHRGSYLIAPHTTLDDPPKILFYIAYRRTRGQNEWVIGPDSINTFLESIALYEGAGNVAYPGSEKIPETMLDRPENLGSPLEEGYHTGGLGGSSVISTYDAHMRLKHYVKPAEELAKRIQTDVMAKEISHFAGREQAMKGRNLLLEETRGKLSPGGRSFSKALKEEGKTPSELIEKYSKEVLEKNPKLRARYGLDVIEEGSDLYKARYSEVLRKIGQSEKVSMEIIKAAGRPNRVVTGVAKVSRVLGPVGTIASLTISGYEIYDAPASQKLHVAAREAGGFAGGTLGAIGGGMVGGWVASLACGPGAPICALIVSVIFVGAGGYMGGRAGEFAGEMLPSVLTAPAYISLAFPAHSLSAGGGYAGLMERDRRVLLEASHPLWMKLNRSIYFIEKDIRFLEGKIRTAEDKEELEELQRLRIDLLLKLNDVTTLYKAIYPDYKGPSGIAH